MKNSAVLTLTHHLTSRYQTLSIHLELGILVFTPTYKLLQWFLLIISYEIQQSSLQAKDTFL